MKRFYTVNEISELFNVTPTTVYSWIKTEKVKAIKMGKSWKISEEEYQRMINEGF